MKVKHKTRGPRERAIEGRQSARILMEFRDRVVTERWLGTLILTIHLECEAIMEELLREALSKPEELEPGRFSFSQRLTLCEALSLIDEKPATSVRALNTLRNELAHNLHEVPSLSAISKFIAAMSSMHPLSVTTKAGARPKKLNTVQQVHAYFEGVEKTEVEELVFVSLMLLRASLLSLLKLK
jgi:hypothetical protein